MRNTRNQIRKQYQEIRSAMPSSLAEQLSEQISQKVLMWDVYQKAGAVFCYYPLGNEVSLMPVIKDALQKGKRLAFPKVSGNSMRFYEVTDLRDFCEGSFHVMEPDNACKKAEWEYALCFTPGSAFDREGGRFGYGKGYYDRYFEKHPRLLRAGIAYENQVEEKLPTEDFDIPINYLITEQGISCGKEQKWN